MFTRFISLLVLVAPLVSALTLSTPSNVTSGGSIAITWTTVVGDPPTFSLELISPTFNNQFAIANNVDSSLGTLNIPCPVVPVRDDYTIEAVNISNITQVYAQTGTFPIGATITSSGSASTAASATGTNTNTLTSTANSLPVASGSTSVVRGSSGTGTGTGTTGSAASTTTPSTAAGLSSRLASTNVYGYAVVLLSAVAGAAAVAL